MADALLLTWIDSLQGQKKELNVRRNHYLMRQKLKSFYPHWVIKAQSQWLREVTEFARDPASSEVGPELMISVDGFG